MSPRQQWRRAAIRWVVQQLGPTIHGVSEREIAFILGIPKSAVNRHLCRMKESGQARSAPDQRRSIELASDLRGMAT
jgi:predicted ArsR family transcriptional regulator